MKTTLFSFALALSFCLLLSACAGGEPERADAPAADSVAQREAAGETGRITGENVDRLLQNDYAEVVRVELAPGDSLPTHQGGPRVVYALSDYRIRFQQGGERRERAFAQGDVHFHEAGTHEVENIGDAPARFVIFQRRGAALPQPSDSTNVEGLAEEAGPSEQEELLNNGTARVHRVTLEADQRLADHRGLARAAYSLSDYEVRLVQGDAAETRTFQTGDAHWHAPGVHAIENVGSSPARFVVVEFKQ